MIIGVLADSHGHAETTAKAVRMLLEHGAEMLLHLGDIGSDEVIDELAGHRPGSSSATVTGISTR